MQVLIIAGGDGTRMQPLTTPKSLWPFRGLTLLEYTIKDVSSLEPSQIIIVTSPIAKDKTSEIAKSYKAQVVVQENPMGMADAVICAGKVLLHSESTLVIDGSTIRDLGMFAAMAAAIKSNPTDILLAGQKVESYKPGGYFSFTGDRVTGIIEKPDPSNLPSHFHKLVLDYFPLTSSLIGAMSDTHSSADDVYEAALTHLATTSSTRMVEVSGYRSGLKHAPRVLDVMEHILAHRLMPGFASSAQIAESAVIEGDVEIGEHVRILDHATIKGPSYIGANTVVGQGALIRSSCIEADCKIGYNTEVARSYIGPETKCHTAYIGDSIIEGDSNLAAGTITANLRFDEQTVRVNLPSGKIDTGRRKFGAILARGVKTGIHTSIMPGYVAESGAILQTDKGVK